MPFLRFTRDKRGYETTALVHATRRHGKAQQQILYWFRTPPGVKVGRPALDEEAIRWIEEHNPDIEFDWPRILQAQPAPVAPEEPRGKRGKRDRTRERPRPVRPERRPESPDVPALVVAEPEVLSPELEELEPEAVENLVEPPVVVEPPAVESIDAPDLVRLRARYAEILARINERGGDGEHIKALRSQAEALNPDGWVTPEEVRKGQEEFESRIRDLRSALGLRRRRRSRRGGRRHRRPEGPTVDQTSPEAASSKGEAEEGEEEESE